MQVKRQKIEIKMELPPNEKLIDAPEIVEFLMITKLRCGAQGIICRVFVDNEEMEFERVDESLPS